MKISINKNLLSKYLNPFSPMVYPLVYLSKEDLENEDKKALSEMTLEKRTIIEKIKASHLNKDEIIIAGEINYKNELKLRLKSSKENYIARMLDDNEKIEVILDKNDPFLLTEARYFSIEESNEIRWEVNTDLLTLTWEDPNFVITQLNKNKGADEKAKQELYKMIPLSVWENPLFFNHLFSLSSYKRVADHIPESIWESSIFLNELTNNPNLFNQIWKDFLLKKYKSKNTYPQLKNRLNTLFNDENWVINNQKKLNEFYPYLSEKNKCNKDFIMLAIKLAEKDDEITFNFDEKVERNIPKEGLSEDIIIFLWNTLGKDNKSMEDLLLEKIITQLNNKELIYKVLPHLETNYNFSKIWHHSKFKLNDDIDVIKLFIRQYPYIYESLKSKYKENNEIKECLVQSAIHHKAAKLIPRQYLYEIEDDNLIKNIIKIYPNLLFSDKDEDIHPKVLYWRQRIEYLELTGEFIEYIIDDHEMLNEIIGLDKDMCLKLIKQNSKIYQQLPLILKKDIDIVMIYIQTCYDKSNYVDYDILPKELWYNKSLCLNVLGMIMNKGDNYPMEQLIPTYYWNDKSFIETYFNLLDQEIKNNKKLILHKYLPENIKKVLQAYNVTEDYSTFFLNYILNQQLKTNDYQQKAKI